MNNDKKFSSKPQLLLAFGSLALAMTSCRESSEQNRYVEPKKAAEHLMESGYRPGETPGSYVDPRWQSAIRRGSIGSNWAHNDPARFWPVSFLSWRMNRCVSNSRTNWQRIVESQGLLYHSNPDATPYWDESAHYRFSLGEIERLERVAKRVASNVSSRLQIPRSQTSLLGELGIPESLHEPISKSWRFDDWEVYGRFDFTLSPDGIPKLLEYNADVPTSLLEASLIQWHWKEECWPRADQFNSLHEELIARWKLLLKKDQVRRRHKLYLSSSGSHMEDRMTVGYMGEVAEQAGIATRFININDIGWNPETEHFVDLDEEPIHQLFKLYPWDWMGHEYFGQFLANQTWHVFEPPWKALCNNKALLLVLQDLYPDHPNLLRVSRNADEFDSYARKPIFGREGSNVRLVADGKEFGVTTGPYADDPVIYQEFAPLFRDGKNFAQLGVWMVGDKACGLGVREDEHPILRSSSRFLPHIII